MGKFKMEGLDWVADLIGQAKMKQEIEMGKIAKSPEDNSLLKALRESAEIPVNIVASREPGDEIRVSIEGSPISIQVGAIAIVEGVFRTFREHASKDPAFATSMASTFSHALAQKAIEQAEAMRKEFLNE